MDFSPETIRVGLISYLIVASSVALHEAGHCYASDALGDPTARSQGRVTLNPLAHLDLIGTVLIPLAGIFGLFGGFAMIGWGKPAPFNPACFRHRARDTMLSVAAGPAVNLAIAFIAAVVVGLFGVSEGSAGHFAWILLQINIGLLAFNLLPIPPLDGSWFLKFATGMSWETHQRLSQHGWIILLAVLNIPPLRALLFDWYSLVAAPFLSLARVVDGLAR